MPTEASSLSLRLLLIPHDSRYTSEQSPAETIIALRHFYRGKRDTFVPSLTRCR